MPIQIVKDPETGAEREVYVAPKASAQPKPEAKKEDGGPLGAVRDVLGNAIMSSPVGIAATSVSTGAQAITAGAQEFARTGDLGKAGSKAQEVVRQQLEAPTVPATVLRIAGNAGRNFAQELSDVVTADVPAALGLPGAKPTGPGRPDAPFLGVMPPLPKLKSSGPAEDLATGIAQVALEWVPAARAVKLAGRGLQALPGAARVAQGVTAAKEAAAGTRIAQAAAKVPGARAVGGAITSNTLTRGAATGALIDFAGFDQTEGRLYDLADKLTQQVTGTPLEVPVLNYLRSGPDDVGVRGRLKNVVEGAFVGTTAEFLMKAFRAAKYMERLRNAPEADRPVAAQQAAEAAQDLEDEVVRQGQAYQEQQAAATAPRVSPATAVALDEANKARTEAQVRLDALKEPPRPQKGEKGTDRSRAHTAYVRERNLLTKDLAAAEKQLLAAQETALKEQPATAAPAPETPALGTPAAPVEPAARAAAAVEAPPAAAPTAAAAETPTAAPAPATRPVITDVAPDELLRAGGATQEEINGLLGRAGGVMPGAERLKGIAWRLRDKGSQFSDKTTTRGRMLGLADELDPPQGPALPPAAAVPAQQAETRALLDRAMANLPPEKRAAVQRQMEERGLAQASDGTVREFKPLEPDAIAAVSKSLTEEIRRIAGEDVAIRYQNSFELAQKPKSWGGRGTGKLSYLNGTYDPIEDLIQINGMGFDTPVSGKLQTAFHEAWHRVQFNFLTSKELRALNSMYAQLRMAAPKLPKGVKLVEQQAVAFQRYAYAKKEGLPIAPYLMGVKEEELRGLRDREPIPGMERAGMKAVTAGIQVFDALADFVEKANNFIRNRGWTSTRSIFEQAYSGKLAQTRADMGNAYGAYGEGSAEGAKRVGVLEALQAKEAIPLTERNRGVLYSASDEVPVQPPTPDDVWAQRFVDQMMANREALQNGDLTMEDLLQNNVLKLESPSGATKYQPVQPREMVEAYRAHSDLVTRVDATGIPVMSDEQIAADTAEWLEKANYSSKAVLENLKRLSGPLSAYRENLVAMRAAALYVDHTNLQAGTAATRWLNGQMDEAADMTKLTTELVTAAAAQDRANRAFVSVTRPLGQLLRSTQVPRPAPGTVPFDDVAAEMQVPSKNIAEEMETALQKDQDQLVAETIGERISPETTEAIVTGDYSNPKVVEELNALALNMAQGAVTPGFAQGFFPKFSQARNLGAQGLMMYRSSQILSSGITFWGNVLNSALRTVELPFTQAMGAMVQGAPVRASRSLMIYGQYVSNLMGAFRMGVESFKVGRGLFDLDRSQVDALDRLAAADAQADAMATPQKGEWNLNTVPWLSVQDKSNWAIAQRKLWQGLNLSSRLQVSIDSAFKTLVGQSFEYVRNLQPGLDHAVQQGMDGNSAEAWRFARDYAQAAVDRRLKDVTIDGKTILDAVMDSPYAQTATRWATFTDDIWAQMEPRTVERGLQMAQAKGLKGDEATTFAQEYVNQDPRKIPFFARTFSMMPYVWQNLLDDPKVGPLFSLIQPFNRTPGDIVKSVARKTPLAPLVDTWWRDVFSEDAMTRDRAIGDIAVGSSAIALASLAMTHGNVEFTGGGPVEPNAKRKWTEQDGKQPYSFRVKVGTDENGNPIYGPWVSMRALDPFSSLFGGLADYQELANKVPTEARERLGGALILDLVSAVAAGQLSKTYYQGFAEFAEMVMGLTELDVGPNRRHPTARYLERLVASFAPYSSALRAGRRIEDPTAREVPASNNPNIVLRLFEETANEIRNMVPGWSENLPPKRNWITGDPIILAGVWGDQFLPPESPWLSFMMQANPASPFQIKRDPGEKVLREMGQLTGRGAGFIGPRATDFTDGGKIKDNRLDPYEYEQYVLAISRTPDQFGRTLLQALEEEIDSDLYKETPQGQPSEQVTSLRAAALNQVITQYLKLGRETFLSGPYGKRLRDNKDWAEGANRDVQFRLKYGQPIDVNTFVESLR